MRDKKLKQDIVCIALILLLCAYFIAPTSAIDNHSETKENKTEVLINSVEQEEVPDNVNGFDKIETFKFENTDTSSHSDNNQQ